MIEAVNNHIIIKQSDNEEKMYGSMLISDAGKEKPMMGVIIDVGPGTYLPGTDVFKSITAFKKGETVIVPSFAGQRVTYEGEEFLIYKEQDILAKIV